MGWFLLIWVGLVTPVLAEENPAVVEQEKSAAPISVINIEEFLAKNDTEKQTYLLDLVVLGQKPKAQELLMAWDKAAAQGTGPSDFLKSFIGELVAEDQLIQEAEETK